MEERSTSTRPIRWWHGLAVLLMLAAAAGAEEGVRAPLLGQRISEVIDTLRGQGYEIAYSTATLDDRHRVLAEPDADDAIDGLIAVLAPHGLTLRLQAGVWLVVPAPRERPGADRVESPAADRGQQGIENVIVSASRYALSRDLGVSRTSLDQQSIQALPDIGEDPVRAAHRLPGAAASGASAAAHFRGGELGEIGIMLNGQSLFDPFHIRDYQGIFSTVDARAVDGVEVFTGGFPARYGDRMSGFVLMNSLAPERERHTEIGLSVFNTSFLTAGRNPGSNWLLSARRGNLDLVINPELGEPSYFDVFGEYGIALSPTARLSFNGLLAHDTVSVVLESETAEREQVSSDTQNAQFWARLEMDWSASLGNSTVLSYTNYSNRRDGVLDDEEKMVATVADYRDVEQIGLRQDWLYTGREGHRIRWGLQALASEARFDYDGQAEYFGLPARFPGQPAAQQRRLQVAPEGGSYAIYFSDRFAAGERTTIEWGLRWDDQTYTGDTADAQLSPRLSLLYRTRGNTELRFAAGRYFQSQPIEALQVEDGITEYWPAQRADHVIVGLQRRLRERLNLRIELYYKDFGRVRPRFENLFDPLGLIPELQADRIRLAPNSARARGVEASLSRDAGPLRWWSAYAWSRVEDRFDDGVEPRSWDQAHALQGGIEWRGERWTFAAAAGAHTGWPRTDLSLIDGVAIAGRRNARRHPTFASLDLRISRRFDLQRGSLLAFIEVSNATNRRNVCCIDWDIDEDDDGNEFLESSPDYWMPLLPAIGILWEF